jgi:hypothetical protein
MIQHNLLATLFTTFALTQWLIISSIYVFDASRVFLRTQRAYRLARSLRNGRALALRVRRQASWKHLVISTTGLLVGLASTYRWVFLPHPPPDTEIFSMIMTEGLVLIMFLMWRIKRDNLSYIRQIDEIRQRHELQEDTAHLQESVDAGVEIAKDTNQRVTEMQQRGQADQPEEQADREEGRVHRYPPQE